MTYNLLYSFDNPQRLGNPYDFISQLPQQHKKIKWLNITYDDSYYIQQKINLQEINEKIKDLSQWSFQPDSGSSIDTSEDTIIFSPLEDNTSYQLSSNYFDSTFFKAVMGKELVFSLEYKTDTNFAGTVRVTYKYQYKIGNSSYIIVKSIYKIAQRSSSYCTISGDILIPQIDTSQSSFQSFAIILEGEQINKDIQFKNFNLKQKDNKSIKFKINNKNIVINPITKLFNLKDVQINSFKLTQPFDPNINCHIIVGCE